MVIKHLLALPLLNKKCFGEIFHLDPYFLPYLFHTVTQLKENTVKYLPHN